MGVRCTAYAVKISLGSSEVNLKNARNTITIERRHKKRVQARRCWGMPSLHLPVPIGRLTLCGESIEPHHKQRFWFKFVPRFGHAEGRLWIFEVSIVWQTLPVLAINLELEPVERLKLEIQRQRIIVYSIRDPTTWITRPSMPDGSSANAPG